MQHLKNLTNSPYEIRLASGGREMLPARGELGPVEIDPQWLPFYRAVGYFMLTDGVARPKPKPSPDPLDHDGDGEPGGSVPSEDRGLNVLRADAEGLGIDVDKRWGAKRLQAEIDKALAA